MLSRTAQLQLTRRLLCSSRATMSTAVQLPLIFAPNTPAQQRFFSAQAIVPGVGKGKTSTGLVRMLDYCKASLSSCSCE
jgi:hypothetical protein